MIEKVLVAVDGSENSVRALDFGLDLAEKYGASLTVLNVSESPALGVVPQEPSAYSPLNMISLAKDMQKIHQDILSKAVAHAREVKPNVEVFSKFRAGDAAEEIVAESREGGFGVVVVGHVGLGRVQEFLGLGGISEKVAHLASCPVVIVR